MPPIRDRKEDILPTAMSILKNLKKKHNISVECFSHNAINTLIDYDWPGNVRELENTLERVVLIHDKPIIESDDIKYILDESSASSKTISSTPSSSEPQVAVEKTMEETPSVEDAPQPAVPAIDTSSIKTLKELEYEAISAGLERTNWNMTTTAQQLGISRMTLYRKLDQHGLRKKDG